MINDVCKGGIKNSLVVFVFLLLCKYGVSQNPIYGNVGISDPHIRVCGDSIYLYSGHDDSPEDRTWVMKDWRIFSTADLSTWNHVGTIRPADNYMGKNSEDCWAGDAIERNGTYYFYFSDRKRGVGVMTSSTPYGPFTDALGKPIVSPMHDPTILIADDENKTPYLVYGDKEGGGFRVCRLKNNMIEVDEVPKVITIHGKEWGEAPIWMDKNYIFKYNGTYYLSWGRDYATSNNIYGPYTTQGAIGTGHHLNELAHGSFFQWKGQFYHVWCYYNRPGYKYRSTIISYCHIDDKGRLFTDTKYLDSHFATGVGQYEASWDKIEAEWFYEKSAKHIYKKSEKNGGLVLSGFKNDDWIRFAHVTFTGMETGITIAAKSLKSHDDTLEVRKDSPSVVLLGTIKLSHDMEKQSLQTHALQQVKGICDIYLVLKSEESHPEVEMDWFSFTR